MIDRNHENSDAGSSGIPYAGSDGSTDDSRMVLMDEQRGTGPNEKPEWARKHMNEGPVQVRTRNVLRKTELHGRIRTRDDARKTRKHLLHELKDSSNGEVVARFERVLGGFIDTIIERQNRIEDTLLLQIAEIEQRADDLEQRIMERGRTAPTEQEVNG